MNSEPEPAPEPAPGFSSGSGSGSGWEGHPSACSRAYSVNSTRPDTPSFA